MNPEPFFLGGSLAPAGLWVSYLRAPIDAVVEVLTGWRTGLGQSIDRSPVTLAGLPAELEPYESPWSREILLDCGEWTAYLNNGIDGGDPSSAPIQLCRSLGVRMITAGHRPLRGSGHGGTHLWVLGPDGVPPLMYRRTIDVHAIDGRWRFETSGTPLDFEQPARYTARRVRDRFDRPMLIDYLAAAGVRADDPGFHQPGQLIHQRTDRPARRESASQVRARFGWPEPPGPNSAT